MHRLRDGTFAGPVFTGDENVRLGRSDARDQLQHRPHRRCVGNQHRPHIGLERSVLGFEPLLPPQGARELDLGADNREQPCVFPRLLHEVAGAAPHRLDRDFDAAPRGHDDHRQCRVVAAQLRQQIEPFLPRGRVARVVQIHQHHVVVVAVDGLENRRGGTRGLDSESLGLQQQTQCFEHGRLIVGDQHPRHRRLGPDGHRLSTIIRHFDRPPLCSSHGISLLVVSC